MSSGENEELKPQKLKSLQRLASKNFTRFALEIQHMSEAVQLKLIEQLPEFRTLATDAIEKITKAHESTLKSMEGSESHLNQAFAEWRGALIAMVQDPHLSLDEKLSIVDRIGDAVRQQASTIAEQNKAKALLFLQAVVGSVAVLGIIAVTLSGGKFMADQGGTDS